MTTTTVAKALLMDDNVTVAIPSKALPNADSTRPKTSLQAISSSSEKSLPSNPIMTQKFLTRKRNTDADELDTMNKHPRTNEIISGGFLHHIGPATSLNADRTLMYR